MILLFKYGHVKAYCKEQIKNEQEKNLSILERNKSGNMYVQKIKINKKDVDAIFITGASVSVTAQKNIKEITKMPNCQIVKANRSIDG